jgi:MFS family permease
VPPYAIAAVATVLVGWVSDRQQRRGIYNVCLAPVGIVGFVMLAASTSPGVQYAGTFLGVLGIYPTIPVIIAWVANNTEGVYKRGIVLGFVIGWGNLNGIVSSNVFFNAPHYYEGHGIIIAYLTLFVLGGSAVMWALLERENKARRGGKRDWMVEGKSSKEIEDMGDVRPDFIYTT